MCGCVLQPGDRGIACTDDGLECPAFVLEVALGHLDQVRDQVVAARQLHIDLGERVLVGVACRHQAIVDANHHRDEHGENDEDDPAHGIAPG